MPKPRPKPILIPATDQEKVAERFWGKVLVRGFDECWPWIAGKFDDDYGAFYLNGRTVKAHRVAFVLAHGPIPNEFLVCHKCDNHPCCNPSHLFAGTESDNQQDMRRKGRGNNVSGENHPLAKLTWGAVAEIRASHETQKVLADRYGVNQPLISLIERGLRWTK